MYCSESGSNVGTRAYYDMPVKRYYRRAAAMTGSVRNLLCHLLISTLYMATRLLPAFGSCSINKKRPYTIGTLTEVPKGWQGERTKIYML